MFELSPRPIVLLALVCASACLAACVQEVRPKDGAVDTGAPDTDPGDTDLADTDPGDTDSGDTDSGDTDTGPGDTDSGGADDVDSDEDGLTDAQEAELGTDAHEPDSDDDGSGDWEEVLNGTDPLEPDTDDDGVPDGADEDPGTDPSSVDSDGDGLTDDVEEILGTDPGSEDSDDDGFSDVDELAYGTDPVLADADGDRLSDEDEVEYGTDSDNADTDGDGLSDRAEIFEYGTDPLAGDSDGDGADDATEMMAGSDAWDPDSMPGSGPGDVVRCTSVTRSEGRELYDEAIARGLSGAAATAMYSDWNPSLSRGTECSCEVELFDATPTETVGVSVWIPARAHDGTDWEGEALPAGVMLELPSAWPDATTRRLSTANELDDQVDDLGAEVEHWFAFDDVSSNLDDEYDLSVAAPLDVSGTYTIWVSFANTAGERMGTCDALAGGAPEDSLHFRVDTPASMAARFTRPSGPPRPDPQACVPGTEGTSTFALADVGQGPQPLLVAGAPRVVGARLREVTVTAWNGADRLELRRPGGVVAVLTPQHPSVVLGQHELPLAHARWAGRRATPGSFTTPDVKVRHACPSGPPAPLAADTTSVTWAELDPALRAATGGLGLGLWRAGLATSGLPAIRAYVERGDAALGDPDHLVFEALGGGRLDALLLAESAPGAWTFDHQREGLELDGTVLQSGNDLLFRLSGGALVVGGVTMSLAPAQLLFLGGATQ